MSGKRITNALNYIDDRLIEEALDENFSTRANSADIFYGADEPRMIREESRPRSRRPLYFALGGVCAAAAAFAVIAGSGVLNRSSIDITGESTGAGQSDSDPNIVNIIGSSDIIDETVKFYSGYETLREAFTFSNIPGYKYGEYGVSDDEVNEILRFLNKTGDFLYYIDSAKGPRLSLEKYSAGKFEITDDKMFYPFGESPLSDYSELTEAVGKLFTENGQKNLSVKKAYSDENGELCVSRLAGQDSEDRGFDSIILSDIVPASDGKIKLVFTAENGADSAEFSVILVKNADGYMIDELGSAEKNYLAWAPVVPKASVNEIFIIGPDGNHLMKSDLKTVIISDPNSADEREATADELTEENFRMVECEGFAYAKLPSGKSYNRFESQSKFNASYPYEYMGDPIVNDNKPVRVNVGDEICGMIVVSAKTGFSSEETSDKSAIYTYWQDYANEIKLSGQVKMTGRLRVEGYHNADKDNLYGVYFTPDEKYADALPILAFTNNAAEKDRGYVSYAGEITDIYLGSVSKGPSAKQLKFDQIGSIGLDYNDIPVEVTIDGFMNYADMTYGADLISLKRLDSDPADTKALEQKLRKLAGNYSLDYFPESNIQRFESALWKEDSYAQICWIKTFKNCDVTTLLSGENVKTGALEPGMQIYVSFSEDTYAFTGMIFVVNSDGTIGELSDRTRYLPVDHRSDFIYIGKEDIYESSYYVNGSALINDYIRKGYYSASDIKKGEYFGEVAGSTSEIEFSKLEPMTANVLKPGTKLYYCIVPEGRIMVAEVNGELIPYIPYLQPTINL